MDKDTILDYVTETPGNTNRAVLGSMLDSISGGSMTVKLVVVDDTAEPVISSINKTYAEIDEAIQNGIDVVVEMTTTSYLDECTIMRLNHFTKSSSFGNAYVFIATMFNLEESYIKVSEFSISSRSSSIEFGSIGS